MDNQLDAANESGGNTGSKRDAADRTISNIILGGLLSTGIGSVTGALIISSLMLFDDLDNDLSFAYYTLVALATGLTIPGAILTLAIVVTLVLPMRHFWKRTLSLKWMTPVSAVWGAFLAGIPWLIRLLFSYFSDTVVYSAESSQNSAWTMPLIWCGFGLMYGGLFGFWYAYFEKRNSPIAQSKTAAPFPVTSPPKPKEIRISWAAWGLSISVIAVAFGLTWWVTTPLRMVAGAKRVALSNQEAILAEAQMMLEEAKSAEMGNVEYGWSGKKPLPKNFAKMGDYSASTSERYPGAVKVSITGGFTHLGLFIVPEPTSATIPMLRDNVVTESYGSLTVLNDHIYKYSEGF